MSEPAKPTSEAEPEHPIKLIAQLKKEWPIVRENPFTCLGCFFAGCAAIYALFSMVIIPGKDSTIESLRTRLDNGASQNRKADETTTNLSKTSSNQTQWYLRIKSIEVIPKTPNDHPQSVPFRIEAIVNSQNYSFPSTQLCFIGENSTQGEAVPLPAEHEKYLVQFVLQSINRMFLRGVITNSSVPTPGGTTDIFECSTLPTLKTNEIVIQDLQTRVDTGLTRIVYEITNH